jgi:hypothetical protein
VKRRATLLLALALSCAPAAWPGAGSPQALADDAAGSASTVEQRILERHGASILTVHAVLAVRMRFAGQSFDQEQKDDVTAVVVDPSGLLMISDGSQEMAAVERQFPGSELSMTPKTLQVVLPGDETDHDAILVARDANLGLAFLQVLGLEGKTLAAVDLGSTAEPKLLAPLYGVSRLPRGFDYAPQVQRLYARQHVEQPRPMWGIAGDFGGSGLPAFDATGAPVGILITQSGAVAEGGSSGRALLDMGAFLLPLAPVHRLLEQVKKRVPEALEKAKKAAAEPAAAPKDAPPAGVLPTPTPPMPTPAPKDPPKEPPAGR